MNLTLIKDTVIYDCGDETKTCIWIHYGRMYWSNHWYEGQSDYRKSINTWLNHHDEKWSAVEIKHATVHNDRFKDSQIELAQDWPDDRWIISYLVEIPNSKFHRLVALNGSLNDMVGLIDQLPPQYSIIRLVTVNKHAALYNRDDIIAIPLLYV